MTSLEMRTSTSSSYLLRGLRRLGRPDYPCPYPLLPRARGRGAPGCLHAHPPGARRRVPGPTCRLAAGGGFLGLPAPREGPLVPIGVVSGKADLEGEGARLPGHPSSWVEDQVRSPALPSRLSTVHFSPVGHLSSLTICRRLGDDGPHDVAPVKRLRTGATDPLSQWPQPRRVPFHGSPRGRSLWGWGPGLRPRCLLATAAAQLTPRPETRRPHQRLRFRRRW